MQKYTKVYFDYFGYTIADFVPCEICSNRATEIHHILNRSHRKDLENDITNLMAVCRSCHTKYGDNKNYIDFLQITHANKIKQFAKNKP